MIHRMMVPENLKKANGNSNLTWKLDYFVELAPLAAARDRQQENPVLVLEHTHCVNNTSNKNKNKQTMKVKRHKYAGKV